jgi:hypothetical protein
MPPAAIQTRKPSKPSTADLRQRPRGHREIPPAQPVARGQHVARGDISNETTFSIILPTKVQVIRRNSFENL